MLIHHPSHLPLSGAASRLHLSGIASPLHRYPHPVAALTRRDCVRTLSDSAGVALLSAILSVPFTPLPAAAETEVERRDALARQIEERGGLDPSRRGGFNEKALFQEDFYYKYGLRPTPSEVQDKYSAELPYSPVARRYGGYSKYSGRVSIGLLSYAALRGTVESGDWAAVAAALRKGTKGQGDANKAVPPAELRSFARALGLLSNTLLQSDNDSSTTAANLLARHLVNEAYFAMDDMEAAAGAGDAAAARKAWRTGAEYINAYLGLVNRAITPKVGERFEQLSLG